MVALLERLEILLDQETLSYKTEDYLSPEFQRIRNIDPFDKDSSESSSARPDPVSTLCELNELWREKICEWCFQIVDHFGLSRLVVSVSMHYLDRYLSTRTVNKKIFQLAAMTCLYIAIKLYEPGVIGMKSMIDLSRGFFTVEDMAKMELEILRALSWKLHPPTVYCFIRHFLMLLPYDAVPVDTRHGIVETARFLSELSVIDYYFVCHRPSHVALACLGKAMDTITGIPESAKMRFLFELQRLQGFDPEHEQIYECRDRLDRVYAEGGYDNTASEQAAAKKRRVDAESPVCVMYGLQG